MPVLNFVWNISFIQILISQQNISTSFARVIVTFRPGFHITVTTQGNTGAVTGACTVEMCQFNPSSTADSELQTAPVAEQSVSIKSKIAGSRTQGGARALSGAVFVIWKGCKQFLPCYFC